MENEILEYLGTSIKSAILSEGKYFLNQVEEIRIRANQNIIVAYSRKEKIINYKVTSQEILAILQSVCNNSIYSFQNQICEGFITIKGGHRVGITGNVVVKDGNVINISHVFSLNFRIAREFKGCSKEIFTYLFNNGKIKNSLIVSPPGAGKTTILRDIALQLSSGNALNNFNGCNVSIIDERGEITGMYNGIPQKDVGPRTDILYNVPKVIGMKMAIRSMAPNVVIADEIGNKNDAEIINYAICSGVSGIFTAHGSCMQDLLKNPELQDLINKNIFENIIFLDENEKGKIKHIERRAS